MLSMIEIQDGYVLLPVRGGPLWLPLSHAAIALAVLAVGAMLVIAVLCAAWCGRSRPGCQNSQNPAPPMR